jgi:integrase/recombinase XerC
VDATEAGWIDRFIRHLEYERRLSPETCKHYRRDLNALSEYCGESGVSRWPDVDSEHLRAWSATSFRRGLSPRSIQRRLSAARTFFRYLLREKHVRTNPVQSVSAPKGAKRLPDNLDADRMARLLDIPGKGPLVDRDRAILELL